MILISNWARQHIVVARLLITLLHIYLFSSSIYLAQFLIDAGFKFSVNQAILITIGGFCIITSIEFYKKGIANRTVKIWLQKFRFLVMGICCTVFLTGFFSSQLSSKCSFTDNVQAAFTEAKKMERPVYDNYSDKAIFYKDLQAFYNTCSRKELKKELRHQLREMAHKPSDTGSALIILLFVVLAAVAASLLAALSCSLACNGQGALALLVLVGGIAGIVLLAAYLGKKLRKDRAKRKAEKLKTTN